MTFSRNCNKIDFFFLILYITLCHENLTLLYTNMVVFSVLLDLYPSTYSLFINLFFLIPERMMYRIAIVLDFFLLTAKINGLCE